MSAQQLPAALLRGAHSPAWRLLHGRALVLHVKFTRGSMGILVKKAWIAPCTAHFRSQICG